MSRQSALAAALLCLVSVSPADAAMKIAASGGTASKSGVTLLDTRFEKGDWLPAGGDWTGFAAGSKRGEGGGGTGVYGVELRGGDNGRRATWEIGVGAATSQKDFNQGQWDWGCDAKQENGCGIEAAFRLEWSPDGLVFALENQKAMTVIKAPPGAGLSGNTLKIFAKGDASLTLHAIDGTEMKVALAGGGGEKAADALFLYSPLRWARDGLVAKGVLRMKGGGNSARAITFSEGDFTPDGAVPEPEAWSLMIIGFAFVGAAIRRQRYLLTL
jgi:hypothetical protein